MSSSLRRLTRCAVLTALALALSVAEGLVPLTILFPCPACGWDWPIWSPFMPFAACPGGRPC
ncbi:MAG: hypothetical protein ACLRIS_03675 [Flavonifractor plautii]